MLFTEGRFFLFFLAVFAVHWGLRGARSRKLWLLAASYAFYAGWDARFLFLILASTLVDYGCGRAMGRHPERRARRPWLVVSLISNLGLLGFFKYFDFFVESAAAFSGWLGIPVSVSSLGILLPVGISFFTFQTMSYSIDVYRGRLAPRRDPVDFALFVAFFPQLVAGPIVRAVEFLPQLDSPRRFAEHVAVRSSLVLFLVGFVKKACVADGVGHVVDPVFAEPALYSAAAAWIAVALYHVQIYCDFSGYSDMAIATAGLLGYRLPDNFNFPYFSRGIGEFWRRWHITLATWMRDYLFLPLVGRSPSPARRTLSLFLTMALCGLWHGAGWQFVSFGSLHGVYLVAEELWVRSGWRRTLPGRATRWLAWPLLTFFVLMTWPVFRIGSFEDTRTVFGTMFGVYAGGPESIDGLAVWFLLGCGAVHWVCYKRLLGFRFAELSPWLFPIYYGFAWSMTLPWVADGVAPFIYFQF